MMLAAVIEPKLAPLFMEFLGTSGGLFVFSSRINPQCQHSR
jgi:hypothetical protein